MKACLELSRRCHRRFLYMANREAFHEGFGIAGGWLQHHDSTDPVVTIFDRLGRQSQVPLCTCHAKRLSLGSTIGRTMVARTANDSSWAGVMLVPAGSSGERRICYVRRIVHHPSH